MRGAIILLLLAIFTVSFCSSLSKDSHPHVPTYAKQLVRYLVTIDAGSSGSRVHVHHYFFSGEEIPKFNPVSQTLKINPGLSSYADDPSAAAESLKPLLDFAMEHIPEPLWKSSPVYLKATAGLRSIPSDKAEKILDKCRMLILSYPFMSDPANVKIIPGQEEGLFGWVAANYLRGEFRKDNAGPSVGVIEMGGASMQVSFVPTSEFEVADHSKLINFNIAGKSYRLYTHSFLNYGIEAAQELLAEKIKEIQPDVTKPENPCYPVGLEVFGTIGSGNYEECSRLLDSIIDRSVDCPATCSFNGIFQPPITSEEFFAIENFFYTSEFFNALDAQNPIDTLRSEGRNFCQNNWDQILKNFESEKEPEEQLKRYCFSSAYIPKILQDGVGISKPDETVNIVKHVNKASIDWALGSVIYEVATSPHLIPSEWLLKPSVSSKSSSYGHPPVIGASLSMMSFDSLVLFSGIAMIFAFVKVQQQRRRLPFGRFGK